MEVTSAIASKQDWLIYICKACGLFYKEEEGDPDSGIPPGTRFSDIPEDWTCPLCGVSKGDFELYTPAVAVKASGSRPQVSVDAGKSKGPSLLQFSDVVIIGAGKAGWQAAQSLRKLDASISIAIISSCSGDLYDKPMISISVAKKISPKALLKEAGVDAAKRLKVSLFANTSAVGLSPKVNQIRTTRGSFKYGHLIIAQGSKPICPPNISMKDCWHVNHINSYIQLREALGNRQSKVAIIGAGLIGCELANDLALAGHSVDLIDFAQAPLNRLLPVTASQKLLDSWNDLAIKFYGGAGIQAIDSRLGKKVISLSTGKSLEVDQVVMAIGLKAEMELIQNAKLDWTNNGIAVDPKTLQSSQKNIYGIGDCIAINGEASRYIEPIIRQADVIAKQICGENDFYYENRALPIYIKTSALPIRIEGQIHELGVWDNESGQLDSITGKVIFNQWYKNQVQAVVRLG